MTPTTKATVAMTTIATKIRITDEAAEKIINKLVSKIKKQKNKINK